MAIGRLNQRVGKVGKGLAHFSYIMREDKYRNQAEKLEKFEKQNKKKNKYLVLVVHVNNKVNVFNFF